MPEKKQQNTARQLTGLDTIIHAPARLAILTSLSAVQEADFVFLLKQTGLTRGNLSAHLSKLEAVDYVKVEKKFVHRIPRTLLSLTDNGRRAFDDYRKQLNSALGDMSD